MTFFESLKYEVSWLVGYIIWKLLTLQTCSVGMRSPAPAWPHRCPRRCRGWPRSWRGSARWARHPGRGAACSAPSTRRWTRTPWCLTGSSPSHSAVVLWTCCSTGHLFLYSLFCVSSQVLWCVVLYCAMLCLLRRTACRWLAQLGSVLAGQSEPQPREPAPPRQEYQHKSTSHGDCDWRKEVNTPFNLSQVTFN